MDRCKQAPILTPFGQRWPSACLFFWLGGLDKIGVVDKQLLLDIKDPESSL